MSAATNTQGAAVNPQGAKAQRSALLCFALALLTMATTAWFVVEGINATEPDSPARWAKVASGVLLLVLEASAFGLAGQWPEHSKVLRALGWAVLALEITLMSVSQISIGMTAAKSASNGAGTIDEIRAQAKESRAAADALRADAANMRKSKHGWIQQQAGERSAAAAEQSKSAAAAVASLEKHGAVTVSTPIVEIVGKGGLIGLSIALSVALSLSGIVLMHVAGSLWRRASGALPVDVQTLELLQRIHGAPAPETDARIRRPSYTPPEPAPAPAVPAEPAEPAAPAPAPASFKPAETVAPKDYSTGLPYSSKIKLSGAGALAALTAAPMVQAAPAAPAADASAGALKQSHLSAAKQSHSAESEQAQTGAAGAPVGAAAGASAQSHSGAPEQSHFSGAERNHTGASGAAEMPGQSETEQAHPASPSAGKTDAPKRAWTATAVPDGDKLDSAVSGKGATRYNRVKAAVKAGKLKPSMRALQIAEGGGGIVVRRYLQQLETEGIIVRAGRGFALVKKGGAA